MVLVIIFSGMLSHFLQEQFIFHEGEIGSLCYVSRRFPGLLRLCGNINPAEKSTKNVCFH